MSKMAPQIRFQGFTDDWEDRKLEDASEIIDGDRGKNYPSGDDFKNSGHTLFLSATNVTKQGFVFKENQYITNLKSELLGNGKVNLNDIILTSRGSIGHIGLYDERINENIPHARINSGMLILRTNKFNSPSFIAQFLKAPLRIKQIKLISFGSAQPQLTKKDIKKFKITLPKIEEQIKIGAFFKQIDDTIALHQRMLDLLKEQKKGFLQKMFPKNGAKVPELRFKGFTGDWEERKLGEFSDVRDGTHASPKYVSQGHPMVTSKNLTHSGLDMTDVSFLTDEDFNEINKRSKVSIGDILFGMIGTIGNPVIVDRDDFAIKNVALIKEKTSNPITNKWLLPYLKSPSFNRFIQKENAGGTQKFIALGLIRDMKLRVPEFDEQQKIGTFFKKIDETIALHQRKLDLLKEQKKGFLQKMFVS